MKIQKLGHIVLRVGDLEGMVEFYQEVLGLEVIRSDNPYFVFLTIPGEHHIMAFRQLPESIIHRGMTHEDESVLHHFAFKIGDDVAAIKAVAEELEETGIAFECEDNGFTQTVVFDDPEGNTIELYADIKPAPWQQPLARAETFQEVAMRTAGPHHLT